MFSSSRSFLQSVNVLKRTLAAPSTAKGLNLGVHGIKPSANVAIYRNLGYDDIYKHEIAAGEVVTSNGTVTVDTGKFTGRSPKDKYFVDQQPSTKNLWWGKVNKKMTLDTYNKLHSKVLDHFNKNAKTIYVFDGYCGANPASRKKVRFITEIAWQHHFVTNMFLRPKDASEIENFTPDFTIINACKINYPEYAKEGMNSENFVTFNIEKNTALIGGTFYGGEMKKGIFSMMNYWLPLNKIMPMHCSANIGSKGDTALYFGLSGTGKTTLSADPVRQLIGDDEHGWDEAGIFNFEGGCYAKTINLSEETEPDIYRAIKRDALLENVWYDDKKVVDYFNTKKTQNGRVSYPIYHIPNYKVDSLGNHPKRIFFLTCDSFGVLPPISVLSPEQAMYHFLSGYTAKVAGTERDVTTPDATFSSCFGAAFLTLHPTKYADLFKEKLGKFNSKVYLVNTGWSGGSYGVGKRMSIKTTRACINSCLDGSIDSAPMRVDERFGFKVPESLNGVESKFLNPRNTWSNTNDYDKTANNLVKMFVDNFKEYIQPGMTDYSPFGPKNV